MTHLTLPNGIKGVTELWRGFLRKVLAEETSAENRGLALTVVQVLCVRYPAFASHQSRNLCAAMTKLVNLCDVGALHDNFSHGARGSKSGRNSQTGMNNSSTSSPKRRGGGFSLPGTKKKDQNADLCCIEPLAFPPILQHTNNIIAIVLTACCNQAATKQNLEMVAAAKEAGKKQTDWSFGFGGGGDKKGVEFEPLVKDFAGSLQYIASLAIKRGHKDVVDGAVGSDHSKEAPTGSSPRSSSATSSSGASTKTNSREDTPHVDTTIANRAFLAYLVTKFCVFFHTQCQKTSASDPDFADTRNPNNPSVTDADIFGRGVLALLALLPEDGGPRAGSHSSSQSETLIIAEVTALCVLALVEVASTRNAETQLLSRVFGVLVDHQPNVAKLSTAKTSCALQVVAETFGRLGEEGMAVVRDTAGTAIKFAEQLFKCASLQDPALKLLAAEALRVFATRTCPESAIAPLFSLLLNHVTVHNAEVNILGREISSELRETLTTRVYVTLVLAMLRTEGGPSVVVAPECMHSCIKFRENIVKFGIPLSPPRSWEPCPSTCPPPRPLLWTSSAVTASRSQRSSTRSATKSRGS